jgi:hypothetical protein
MLDSLPQNYLDSTFKVWIITNFLKLYCLWKFITQLQIMKNLKKETFCSIELNLHCYTYIAHQQIFFEILKYSRHSIFPSNNRKATKFPWAPDQAFCTSLRNTAKKDSEEMWNILDAPLYNTCTVFVLVALSLPALPILPSVCLTCEL